MTIKKVEEKLHKSCCKETCFDTRQQFWSHNKPESEQCFVTALLLNDIFGGKVIKAKSSDSMNHYWNLIDEKEIDLTRSQFPDDEFFSRRENLHRCDLKKIVATNY